MTDRNMLFSAPMVRALLAGTKTQTRRVTKVVKPNGDKFIVSNAHGGVFGVTEDEVSTVAPDFINCDVGDRLWVREAWRCNGWASDLATIFYRASEGDGYTAMCEQYPIAGRRVLRVTSTWRPSIHMPRWASRLTLTVTEVRVQRLQDITEADAIAEGIQYENVIIGAHGDTGIHCEITADRYWNGTEDEDFEGHESAVEAYAVLWDHINGAGAWDANPWVSATSFTVHHQNIDARKAQEAA